MTLHWWMHWFWITLLTVSVCVCSPVIPTAESTDVDISAVTLAAADPEYNIDDVTTSSSSTTHAPVVPLSTGQRWGKAIGQPPPNTSTASPYLKISVAFPLAESSDTGDEGPALQKELSLHLDYNKKPQDKTEDKPANTTTESPIEVHPEKTVVNATETPAPDEIVTEIINLNISDPSNTTSDVLVPNNFSEVREVENTNPANVTEGNVTPNSTAVEANDNKTVKSEEKPASNSTNNSVIVEISTARALLLETSVGRRAADGEVRKNVLPNDEEGLDAGAVAGICFGSLVIIGLVGAISLVLYRRRYLNRPQTLNDKCSNPDSSGYIDDSTMRENSEEMYSLDNDSFLNSLEAMTIQNYWTDSVKHTKL